MLTEKEEESLNRTDIVIEGSTATWNLRLDGPIKGTYVGAFRFKCFLHPLQKIASSREFREIMGPTPSFANEEESFLAYALTQLKYRIVNAPPFWKSENPAAMDGDIADENIIAAVLDAALVSELKYKTQIKKRKLDAVSRAKGATEQLMEETKANDTTDEDSDEGEDQES